MGSGGSRAAKIASSKTFLSPFCKKQQKVTIAKVKKLLFAIRIERNSPQRLQRQQLATGDEEKANRSFSKKYCPLKKIIIGYMQQTGRTDSQITYTFCSLYTHKKRVY